MLKRLKKANRGIILAVIVLLCFAIWLFVSGNKFKEEETENIEGVLTEYFTKAAEISALSGQEHEDDSVEYLQGLMSSKYEELISEYWAYSDYIENANKYSMYYYTSKGDMLLSKDVFENIDYSDSITSASSSVVVTKVKSNGAEGATAIVDVSVKIGPDLTENGGIFITPDGYMRSDGLLNGCTYKWEDVEVKMLKVDGEWKIVGVVSYWYSILE